MFECQRYFQKGSIVFFSFNLEIICYKLSRGEICVANLKVPCEWCEFGQVFLWPIGTSIQTSGHRVT